MLLLRARCKAGRLTGHLVLSRIAGRPNTRTHATAEKVPRNVRFFLRRCSRYGVFPRNEVRLPATRKKRESGRAQEASVKSGRPFGR